MVDFGYLNSFCMSISYSMKVRCLCSTVFLWKYTIMYLAKIALMSLKAPFDHLINDKANMSSLQHICCSYSIKAKKMKAKLCSHNIKRSEFKAK